MAQFDLDRYTLIDGTKAIPMSQLPPEAWTPQEGGASDTEVAKHYAAVAFMYRCIEVRANAVMGLPWTIARGESVVWESSESQMPPDMEPLRDLMTLLWQTEASLCLHSQAFWFKERNRSRLLNARWLKQSSVTPLWDASLGLTGYERRLANGSKRTYDLDDIAWIWLRGEEETEPRPSAANAALSAAGVLYNVDKFEEQFFERGAIKATLLTVPAGTQPAERERLEVWWNRFFSGIQKAFAQKVVNADAVTPVVVGEGISELSNSALTAEKREDIATALGVPHSLVLSNAANYATSQQDELNFYNMTVIPESGQIAEQLNRQLFRPMGLDFTFYPEKLSIYQEDEEQRSQSLLNLVHAGIPLAIAAEMLGMSLPDGVEYADLVQPEPEAPEPEPQPVTVQMEPPTEADDDRKAVEVATLRRWLKKNQNRVDRLDAFHSDILSQAEKVAIAADLHSDTEDGNAEDAPFPVAEWTDYP